jgi:pSer/pThr/pTyr-binding forkhead associated (FHA) protein
MSERFESEQSITVDDVSGALPRGRAVAQAVPTSGRFAGAISGWLVLDEPGGSRVGLPAQGEPAITVGRDPACAAQTPFDDPHVSRRHAQLAWFSPGWWTVTDLCSSNGTIIGGERVFDPVPITEGQFLQVGRTVYRVEFSPAEPAEPGGAGGR